jgi:regulator of sirC expression with transglutaminase-like and TPR domain
MPIHWLKVMAILFGTAWALACFGASARLSPPDYDAHYRIVESLLGQPDATLDLADIKLSIDALIDPSTDKTAVSLQLDAMAHEVRAMFPAGASNVTRFKALRDYLYRPSPASGRRPFQYNFDDDRNPRAKLLSVYLTTRRGNCISMPLLFVILAQKLDIPVTTATAPAHLYLKFRADNGLWFGVEATNGGGWADDDWQRQQFPSITPEAIANGLYLQPLTLRETAAVMAESLLEHYESQDTNSADKARIKLGALIHRHYRMSVPAMGHSYFGFLGLRKRLFVDKYPDPMDIPPHLIPQLLLLERGWQHWGSILEGLGYRAPTAQMQAEYRKRIERARASERQITTSGADR